MADKTLSPIAIGDSLAQGMRDANQLPGISRIGAGPKEVYGMLERFAASNSLSGRDVFIGTGMPNIPEQKKYVEQQIDFVRKQGGNPILIGVGPGTKSKPTTGQNEFLAGLAESKGLTYMGPLVNMFPDVTKDPMGLHLRPKQYKQIFKQFSQSQAQPQPQPKAQPQQVQPQSREPSAADLLSQFTGAVMQAESQGKRYDRSGKLLTSPKGAQGEMQVMPGTVTDPGFGVRPARDNSPDEIARVGRDYAAVMLRRYNNNPTLAAVAYNWGPGNADRWIKAGADINKLPAETRNYVVRIAGRMGAPVSVPAVAQPSPAPNKRADVRPVPPAKRVETTVSPRAEAPVEYTPVGSTLDTAPRPAEQQQNVVTRADMERLGPSYQAALAATTLADSREDEDDYDDEDTIAERYMERRSEQLAENDSTLEEEPTRTSSLTDLDLTYQSPFAPEPVKMAHGGVVHRAEGSPMYGEGVDLSYSGGITEDTRRAMATRHSFSPREALSLLGQVGREGVSNIESTLRGSVAAIPGFVGDVESGFRDDKNRRFMTTEEVKRDVLPSRLTTPTKHAAGYEELGTYLPLPITPQQILPPSVVRNLITKAKGMLPAKEVDTFPMGKLSAEEVLQQVKSFDPKALERAREAFLASSAEKRRMYHGTLLSPEGKTVVDNRLPGFYKTVGMDQGFTSFKPGTGGMTFVTPNPEFTDLFTGMRFGGKGLASPSRVYPVYVQVKKPFDFENAKHVDELAAEISAAVRKNKGKKDLAWWMTSGGKPVTTDSVRRLLSTGQWGFIEDPIVLEAAKKLGFDGMYMMEAGTKNLGIFDPKKIKSATGNQGSFNVKTPDIRKAEGGIVHRANGSPVYGEVADSGPITSDTRKAFANRQSFDPREALAALKRIAGEGVSNFESMARGSVAGVPGIVGDIESIFRDDKKRKFATSTEVERQYLPKRFTEPTKESQGFVEIGTAIDPSIALKAAPKTAKATLKALKESGPQVEAALMKVAPAAEPMYVVKPKGGVFYPAGSGSNLDNYLETVAENVLRNSPNIPGKEAGRIKELILNKGRKYFTTTYGTVEDPVRNALLEGRIKLVGKEAELLPPELLRAAQDGNPEALSKFDQRYDIWSNLRGEVVSPVNKAAEKDWIPFMTKTRKREQELMRQEGVEDEFFNPQLIHKDITELKTQFPSDAAKMLADLLEKKRGPVSGQEQAIIEAVKREQPIYDVRIAGPEFSPLANASQGIASLTIKDIEKMSYPEMVIRGAQNTLLERSSEALFEAARKGKPIPSESYKQGVTPIKGLENTGWVSVDSPFAVQLEGAAMNHSVGDYMKKTGYGHGGKEGFLSGKAKVFSRRPEGNQPVTTVEGRVDPEGLYISQVKAPYNSLPTPDETREVFKLFDKLRDTYGSLQFKSSSAPEVYTFTREGKKIEKGAPQVNWAEEYSNYLQYRNKGAE
jgi:hypothetical protein